MRVCLLSGGFGGARLAPGLAAAVGADRLTVITNPGDDLEYLGAEIWPDFDMVAYGLAGLFDEAQGWGIVDDTYSHEGWFRIGDRDLELSRMRTELLGAGTPRDDVAAALGAHLGIRPRVVPAAATPLRTVVHVEGGETRPFQEWLVRHRAAERPVAVELRPPEVAVSALALHGVVAADVVLLGPSNPVASLAPILAVPRLAEAVRAARRVVAISPTILRRPPRTPAEAGRYRVRELLLGMLGIPHTAGGCARIWDTLIDGYVLDASDREEAGALGLPVLAVDLLAEQRHVAERVLAFAEELEPRTPRRVPDVL